MHLVTSTAARWETVTPSDTTVINANGLLAIECGGAGNLVIKDKAGNSRTYAVSAGDVIIRAPKYIMATTTATDIVLLYNS